MKIFIWNVHGSYLNALVETGHDFFVPVKEGRPYNYDGKTPGYRWPSTFHEISVEDVKKHKFDLLIYQTPQQVLEEQYLVLTEEQRKTPKVYIVHTPFKSNSRLDDKKIELLKKIEKEVLPAIGCIIHITKYNLHQWDEVFPGTAKKSTVIYHGISIPNDIEYQGDKESAVTAVNNLPERPECGSEVWRKAAKEVPIALYGDNSEPYNGKGSIPNEELKKELSKYRVYFNPTITSSLPMSMLEAMSVGLPVVTTATTDLPNIIKDGYNGFISNDVSYLVDKMKLLVADKNLSRQMGENAKQTIRSMFSPTRFISEWNHVFEGFKKS